MHANKVGGVLQDKQDPQKLARTVLGPLVSLSALAPALFTFHHTTTHCKWCLCLRGISPAWLLGLAMVGCSLATTGPRGDSDDDEVRAEGGEEGDRGGGDRGGMDEGGDSGSPATEGALADVESSNGEHGEDGRAARETMRGVDDEDDDEDGEDDTDGDMLDDGNDDGDARGTREGIVCFFGLISWRTAPRMPF